MGYNRLRLESVAGSEQRGHAEFRDARLLVGLPRRRDKSRDIHRSFWSSIATKIGCRSPVAANPLQAAALGSVEIDPRKTVRAFGDVAAQKDARLAAGR